MRIFLASFIAAIFILNVPGIPHDVAAQAVISPGSAVSAHIDAQGPVRVVAPINPISGISAGLTTTLGLKASLAPETGAPVPVIRSVLPIAAPSAPADPGLPQSPVMGDAGIPLNSPQTAGPGGVVAAEPAVAPGAAGAETSQDISAAIEPLLKSFPDSTSGNKVYNVFLGVLNSFQSGHIPNVIVDYDDTLSRSGWRWTKTIENLDSAFHLGIPAMIGRPIQISDIRYTNSFAGTAKATLAGLGVPQEKIDEIFAKKGQDKMSPAEYELKPLFDNEILKHEPVAPGVTEFFPALLRLMKIIGGRVLIASGREDKHKEVTKRSLVNAGIPEDLLEGKHVVWYLRPTAGRTIESDIHLNFHNNKGQLLRNIAETPRNEVVAVIDNEFRNIVQFINLLPAQGVFYMKSTDATWSKPGMHKLFSALENDLGTDKMGYTPFSSFVPDEAISKWVNQLLGILTGQKVPEGAVDDHVAATVNPQPAAPVPATAVSERALAPDDFKDIRQWLTPKQVAELRAAKLTDDTLIFLGKLSAYFGVNMVEAALGQLPPRARTP